MQRLRVLSQIVDKEANTVRLKADATRNGELVEAMESLGKKTSATDTKPFHYYPQHWCKQFFGRESELSHMHDRLSISDEENSRCVLLHGLGGMGKSRLAMAYVQRHLNGFGAVLWLPADNGVKIHQALADVALQLQLVANDCNDVLQAKRKVIEWLLNLGMLLSILAGGLKRTDRFRQAVAYCA